MTRFTVLCEAGRAHGEIATLRSLAEAMRAAGQTANARARLAAALRLAAAPDLETQEAKAHG